MFLFYFLCLFWSISWRYHNLAISPFHVSLFFLALASSYSSLFLDASVPFILFYVSLRDSLSLTSRSSSRNRTQPANTDSHLLAYFPAQRAVLCYFRNDFFSLAPLLRRVAVLVLMILAREVDSFSVISKPRYLKVRWKFILCNPCVNRVLRAIYEYPRQMPRKKQRFTTFSLVQCQRKRFCLHRWLYQK